MYNPSILMHIIIEGKNISLESQNYNGSYQLPPSFAYTQTDKQILHTIRERME